MSVPMLGNGSANLFCDGSSNCFSMSSNDSENFGKQTCHLCGNMLRFWFQLLAKVVPIVLLFVSPCFGDVFKTSDDELQVLRKCINCVSSCCFQLHSITYYSSLLLLISTDVLLKGLCAFTLIVLCFAGKLWSFL